MPTKTSHQNFMDSANLTYKWIRHHNRSFWRIPIAAFFALVFPLVLLVLLNTLFSDSNLDGLSCEGADLKFVSFFVPAMACFTAASATYTNLGVSLAIARSEGVLKRVRGTPLSPPVYFAGIIGSAVWVALLGTSIMFAVGILFYGLDLDFSQLGWLAIFFLAGVTVFSILGILVASVANSGRAAPAITNATLLPIAFVSNVFTPIENPPLWLDIAGEIFPLKPFAEGFRASFDPCVADERLLNLGVMGLWGVFGLLLLPRFFKWLPKDTK